MVSDIQNKKNCTKYTSLFKKIYLLSADSSNRSNFVSFRISSINGTGLTRVSSTCRETVGALSSNPFLRFSAAVFIRSNDPVSLITNDPELGFLYLVIPKKSRINPRFLQKKLL